MRHGAVRTGATISDSFVEQTAANTGRGAKSNTSPVNETALQNQVVVGIGGSVFSVKTRILCEEIYRRVVGYLLIRFTNTESPAR